MDPTRWNPSISKKYSTRRPTMKDMGFMLILLAIAVSQPASWLGALVNNFSTLLKILG
jgi:hypothetical protein